MTGKIFLDTECKYEIDPTPELIHTLESLVGEDQVYYAVKTRPLLKSKYQDRFIEAPL